MTRRIAILGSGANGAAIGADLTRAGLDVKLIDQWPAHIEAMRADGLTVVMPDRTENTRVDAYHLCDVATFTEPFNVVLMLFKAYDSRWAAELIKPCLADDGVLVGVQNGMTAETIADVVGGACWPQLIDALARGGRYTCAGAIAGPIVEMDLRTFYLRDLAFTGATIVPPGVFADLVGHLRDRGIERGAIVHQFGGRQCVGQVRRAHAAAPRPAPSRDCAAS